MGSREAPKTFIDLFAGCGGLSLGLMTAGWKGLLAIEKDSLAFATLRHNLIEGHADCPYTYRWPRWLAEEPHEISDFIRRYRRDLLALRGRVDLIAGGPPCQGFSLAGQRKKTDPRNKLFEHYVSLVKIVQPPLLLLENVRGISVAFRRQHDQQVKRLPHGRPFSDRIRESLTACGYTVFTRLVPGTEIGVPQLRPRYILIGVRDDLVPSDRSFDPFSRFEEHRIRFLNAKGLHPHKAVTVKQAISDLECQGTPLVACVDSPGFEQITYLHPKTDYQRLMHGSMNGTPPNSLRLARHTPEVAKRFRSILATCRKGVSLSDKDRARFGLKKHCIVPLHPDRPSHTLTTLPDDVLHYAEPRILTVREYARLQSFPDWYAFQGKYTTGGHRRKRECPRYTQAGNAVPPFLAELLGAVLHSTHSHLRRDS